MRPITITLELCQKGADVQYLDELVGSTIGQLSTSGIHSSRIATPPPDGAKSAMDSVASTLLVTCATSPLIVELINYLKEWIERRKGRSIRIIANGTTIEFDGQVNNEKIALITQWLETLIQEEGNDQP